MNIDRKPPRLQEACTIEQAAEWLTCASMERWSEGDVLAELMRVVERGNAEMHLRAPPVLDVVVPSGTEVTSLAGLGSNQSAVLERDEIFAVVGIELGPLLQGLREHGSARGIVVTHRIDYYRWRVDGILKTACLRLPSAWVKALAGRAGEDSADANSEVAGDDHVRAGAGAASKVRKGTQPALTESQKSDVVRKYQHGRGISVRKLGQTFGVSRRTIDAALAAAGVKKATPRKGRSTNAKTARQPA